MNSCLVLAPLTFDADNDSDDYYHFQDCDDDDIEVNPGDVRDPQWKG
ncbi:MAG: hypothetical protein Ct9H90mP24_4650 [Methanobacteriota archaeon]|nr:MAG: hypothetical protein Ct9H90mP24_4650 [Euryarchaeota archaeon]